MLKFGCANNWRRYRRLVKQPRECNLRTRDVSRLGNFPHAVHYRLVHFLSPRIKFFAVLIGPTAHSACLHFPGAGETAARQGTPWAPAQTLRLANKAQFPLPLAT